MTLIAKISFSSSLTFGLAVAAFATAVTGYFFLNLFPLCITAAAVYAYDQQNKISHLFMADTSQMPLWTVRLYSVSTLLHGSPWLLAVFFFLVALGMMLVPKKARWLTFSLTIIVLLGLTLFSLRLIGYAFFNTVGVVA